MRITNSQEQASDNFKICEYWKGTDFDISDAVIKAGQIHRDFFGIPIMVTNTYPDYQSFGYHRLMKAGDFDAEDPSKRQWMITRYNQELMNYISGKGSDLITELRKAGINGFGIENNCIHNDSRPQGLDPVYGTSTNRTDEFGGYTCFKFACHYDENNKMVVDVDEAI